ncbi:MAG: PD-(D/E)XK nuclease family protein, partial [Nitrospinae bacterium]|nr:PD-(D/E)XK nuclease family protein [Nitrospinota bacterium]
LDRTDKTEDGKTILIDYKTGTVDSPKKWFEERMEAPQLPLYALQVQTDAVAYANVKSGEHKFKGITTQDNLIPKLESNLSKYNQDIHSWEDLKNFWKTNLNGIAKEFLEGHLKVAPLDVKDTCKYCDQVTFCRKTELLASANGEEA